MSLGEDDEDDGVGDAGFENWSLKALGDEGGEELGGVYCFEEVEEAREEGGGSGFGFECAVPRKGGSSGCQDIQASDSKRSNRILTLCPDVA